MNTDSTNSSDPPHRERFVTLGETKGGGPEESSPVDRDQDASRPAEENAATPDLPSKPIDLDQFVAEVWNLILLSEITQPFTAHDWLTKLDISKTCYGCEGMG